MKELETYRDLLSYLQNASSEYLDQPIQVANPGPNCDEPIELMPGIAIGTVDQMGFFRCRSMVDNKYHAEELVILIDGNPFAKDGAVAYEWKSNDDTGDIDDVPIYGKEGPTDIKDQTAPQKPSGTVATEAGPFANATMASLRWMTGVGDRYMNLDNK